MMKMITAVSVVLSLALFAACGGGESPAPVVKPEPVKPKAEAPKIEKSAEPIVNLAHAKPAVAIKPADAGKSWYVCTMGPTCGRFQISDGGAIPECCDNKAVKGSIYHCDKCGKNNLGTPGKPAPTCCGGSMHGGHH